jgi:hypothetical protein
MYSITNISHIYIEKYEKGNAVTVYEYGLRQVDL